jgi:hypothetical protein
VLSQSLGTGIEIVKIKWFYSVQTQQYHTIISTLVWLHISAFSRPSSGQYFPVKGTIRAHNTLRNPIMLQGVRKNNYKTFLSLKYC